MSNLSDENWPTFIGVAKSEIEQEVMFIVRDPNFTQEHYNIIIKPTLSDILFHGDSLYVIEDKRQYSYERISIGNFIKGLIAGHQKCLDILADVKRYKENPNYFRQYKDGSEPGKGSTTLDFILLLDQMNKFNEGILKYLLEIEYGIEQVEMVKLFNLTCTKYE